MKNKRKNIVGELINFRGLVYAPINEQGVVFLFGKVAHEFGMYVELIRTGYPDCIAKRFIGRGRWEEIKIEFEHKSSDFDRHGHNPSEADMIVCWEHDWQQCPKRIEIIELKEEINKLENITVETSEKISKSSEYDLKKYLKKRGSKESIALFKKLDEKILKINDEIYSKVHKYRIFYYSPKRVFMNIKIMKKGLNIHLFTNAKKMKGVEKFERDYGQKWGRVYVMKKSDIATALNAIKKSYQYINYCIDNNLTTGWYAEADE
jgi:predicted transport protein